MSRAAWAGVATGTALFVAVQALLGALVDPVVFYAPGVVPVLPPGSPAPGRGVVAASVVENLTTAPFVDRLVPQSFVYTVVAGRPVVVRGGDVVDVLELHGGRLVAGQPVPEGPTLLAGARLAARWGLSVGDVVWVPASAANDLVRLVVHGLVEAPTGLGDELLVDAATGARLARVPPGAASFLEVVPRDAEALARWIDATRAPRALLTEGPRLARAGEEAPWRVVDVEGAPVRDAAVRAPGEEARATDATGLVRVPVRDGATTWTVEKEGFAPASFTVRAAGEADGLAVTSVAVAPRAPRPEEPFEIVVTLRNFGPGEAQEEVRVLLDGALVRAQRPEVAPDAAAQVVVAVREGLPSGRHEARAGEVAHAFVVDTPAALQAQWRLVPASAGALRTAGMQDVLDDVFGSVALAGALLGTLAFLLFFVGNAALVARLVHAHGDDLRLLRALGASRAQVRAWALRRMGPGAVAAAAAGLALGALAAEAYTRLGGLTLFSHALRVPWEASRVGLLALLALACTVGALGVAVEAFLRRHAPRAPARREAWPETLAEALA